MSNYATLLLVALIGMCAGFSPAVTSTRRSVTMSAMPRRAALEKAATALVGGAAIAASGASPALAYGSATAASVARARGLYGERVLALADAVNKGDLKSVAEDVNAFTLFSSGAFGRDAFSPAAKESAQQVKDLKKALKAKDVGAVQGIYKAFVATGEIKATAPPSGAVYQGASSDYDWKVRGDKGYVYVR